MTARPRIMAVAADIDTYRDARREHAWLLRAEGAKLKEIGYRLGISVNRARWLVIKHGYRVGRAMRRTRIIVQ